MKARPVDEVAVRRAVEGEHVPLTRDDRITAVHLLHAQGLGATAIAERLHLHRRQVQRDLAVEQTGGGVHADGPAA